MCPVGRSGHLCDEKLCVPNGFSPRGCRLRQQGMAAYEGARQEAVRRQLCTDAIHRSRWSRGISWYFGILLRDLHVLFSMVFSGFIIVAITITPSFVLVMWPIMVLIIGFCLLLCVELNGFPSFSKQLFYWSAICCTSVFFI